MSRTVYVVTDARTDRVRALRQLAWLVSARVVYLLAFLGHLAVLALGAADALLTALLGLPRLAWMAGRVATVARQTWEEDL